ncbi:MAG: N-acetylmuramoyl-L-alanine amidase [Clostridia bacterium]|nr:N-acetylmuramoyl-L-alanine amidase [Clostridia bacterium]MBR5632611.1 N-acetylmuramoyl-L-alanine amidase [Clostridia bacterium]
MIRIMLDPGHAGEFYNASPVVEGYFESRAMWSLAGKLKRALEKRGFEAALTRQSIEDDPSLTNRGMRSAGYDLFLSLHSNAAATPLPDAPWIITFSPDSKTDLDERSFAAGEALGGVISSVMGISDPFYYTKSVDFDRDGNGYIDDEYYGVLFGAKSVGVPGVILEHGFHTNEACAMWLMSDDNLTRLAEAEADALAKFYNMEEDMNEELEKKIRELEKTVSDLKARLDKYDEMKVYRNAAVRWAYVDGNLPDWAYSTVAKLSRLGYLRGNGENSLELSELMMRLLVILDRAGIWD